jgi:hypothetical protein
MGVKGVWILQELYEGTEASWRPFMFVYLLRFANTSKKLGTIPGDVYK